MPEYWKNATVSYTTILSKSSNTQRKAFVQELIKMDKTAIKRRYTSRVVASTIWSFFRKTDDPAMNQCSTCLLDIDCSQNTTAMVSGQNGTRPLINRTFLDCCKNCRGNTHSVVVQPPMPVSAATGSGQGCCIAMARQGSRWMCSRCVWCIADAAIIGGDASKC